MNVRNFCIISHIDHGKSTLADRFLEITGTVASKDMQEQYLDDMELERERGITIKLRPVRMNYKGFVLNMIDTPGHVDFSYEVSRSLLAVEGAILLVDATKGIQAQTLANLDLARERGEDFVIIPVINKIDMDNARIEETEEEMIQALGVKREDIIKISGKKGINIEAVLDAVIKRILPPQLKTEAEKIEKKPFRALIFDSEYNAYKGIVAHIRVVEGELNVKDKIYLFASKTSGDAKEIGFFSPKQLSQKKLVAGDIGYIATGIKEVGVVRSGDTICKKGEEVLPLPGYKDPKPMVFSSFYPHNADDYPVFKNALYEIKLTDPAFVFEPEFKEVFGRGFRCGFLGSLHSEIISERLRREYDLDLIISAPSVTFRVVKRNRVEEEIRSASDWPDESEIAEKKEPWARIEVITPESMLGSVNEVLGSLRGNYVDTRYLSSERVLVVYNAPLRRVITGFHDDLKGATKGYASAGYKIDGFFAEDLVKMEILIAHEVDEAFSTIVSRKEAFEEGKRMVAKLKDAIPQQQFAVAIQARFGGKIIARETIKARRKDVTGDLYGGDYSRKRKLLEKQKKGKKRLEKEGRVNIPQDAYFKVFKK
jgi:GTP-binding protein LepA